MGDVIEFRPVAGTARRHRRSAEMTGGCQILFFTGVRYERHAEPEGEMPTRRTRNGSKPAPGTKRSKKRA